MPLISICICTFQRPAGLRRALDSLAELQLPAACSVEVLVVDNDPSASAQAGVEGVRDNFPHELRYLCESRRGVGHARNRCVNEAAGEWIAFIDDDEWAEPQWLDELWRCAHSGRYDGVFGPVLASFEVPAPNWLVDSGVYVRHRFPTGVRLAWSDCASGNVLFRKQLFLDAGGFSLKFAASGAEDSEFFWRCQDGGAVFVWCDSAVAWENIPRARMTRRWVRHRAYLAGHNYARLTASQRGLLSFAGVVARGGAAVLVYGVRATVALILRDPKSLAYGAKVASGCGKVMALLSPPRSEYGASS